MAASKIWKYIESDKAQVDSISQQFKINPIVAQVILNRGITEKKQISEFLNPDICNLSDPFLMKDMDKGSERVADAIKNYEYIIVCGDYDVDGITSTAILVHFLRNCGVTADYYIPDRIDDGYGLSMAVAEKIKAMNPELVITVDSGITAVDEVDFLCNAGIDVVITDHHECKGTLPNACAVINPHRQDDEYPFKQLSGVGVVYRFIEAIYTAIKDKTFFQEDIDIQRYIDAVAVGTITDVMPLIGENRTIIKYGIERLNKTCNEGLKALIRVAGLQDKQISAWMIGFVIGPRMNAAGRMSNAQKAVELLLTDSPQHVESIAKLLDEENIYRQETEKAILNRVFTKIEQDIDFATDKIIVVEGDNWHQGVIGIAASKVVDKYNMPCILLSVDGQEVKGSARSIAGFNIYDALCYCGAWIERFGGHELAAGLTLKTQNIDSFKNSIIQYAAQHIKAEHMLASINIDGELQPEELTVKAAEDLEILAPFGVDNPKPIFCCNGMRIVDIKTTIDEKHLKLKLRYANRTLDAIGFNIGDAIRQFCKGDFVDAAFSLEINSWNFIHKVQLNVKDLKKSEIAAAIKNFYSSLDYDSLYEYIANNSTIDSGGPEYNLNKRCNQDCIETLENVLYTGTSKIIFVNTVQGIKDIVRTYEKSVANQQNIVTLCYNNLENSPKSDIYIVVNPKMSEIDIGNFRHVIFYKFACSQIFLQSFAKRLNAQQTINYVGTQPYSEYIADTVNDIVPNRDDLAVVYRLLSTDRNIRAGRISTTWLSDRILHKFNKKISCAKIENSIGIFKELGLVTVEQQEKFDDMRIIINNNGKVDIENSRLYRRMQQIKQAASV